VQRTEVEVTADAFGHDLTRGVANFIKSGRGLDAPAGRRDADGDGPDRAGGGPPEDDQGDDGMMASDRLPYDEPPAGAAASAAEASGEPAGGDDAMVHRIVNDAAVAQFSERLADDGAVARELAEESQPASEDAVPF
jgi:hypothetical protein